MSTRDVGFHGTNDYLKKMKKKGVLREKRNGFYCLTKPAVTQTGAVKTASRVSKKKLQKMIISRFKRFYYYVDYVCYEIFYENSANMQKWDKT